MSNNLQEVVRYVRSALDHKCVFVHMTAPHLEILLAGLEEQQREIERLNGVLEFYRKELGSLTKDEQSTEKCPGCGWYKHPETDGEFEEWEECKNPNCDYEEESA